MRFVVVVVKECKIYVRISIVEVQNEKCQAFAINLNSVDAAAQILL